jgi:transposase
LSDEPFIFLKFKSTIYSCFYPRRGAGMKGNSIIIKNAHELEIYLIQCYSSEVKLRLLFINSFLKNNNDLDHTCNLFHISIKTGYEWIDKWNKNGVNGLKDKPITGRKAKLTECNIKTLEIELKKRDFWDISEVQYLIISLFNISLSKRRISVILREMKMNYNKPYRKDYRRPDNAEEILIEKLKHTFNEIIKDGYDPDNVCIGFMDEAHPQNKANSGKFWSFGKPVMKENTTKYRVNTIGFYSLNGNDAIMFLEDSKEEGIEQFIKEIRVQNPEYDAIIVVLDNFSSHKTNLCLSTAKENGIYFVFIPPYSPDLNPIEFAWKSVRRMISKFFVESKEHLQDIIACTFEKCVESMSLANSWIDKIASKIEFLKFLNNS